MSVSTKPFFSPFFFFALFLCYDLSKKRNPNQKLRNFIRFLCFSEDPRHTKKQLFLFLQSRIFQGFDNPMGSGFSLFQKNLSSCYGDRDLLQPGLGDLPESCVALILQNLDPVEICRFSKLNTAFHGASWADFVWESKLPPDYKLILEKILGSFPDNLRKRDIFTFLSRVNSFDEGNKVRLLLDFFGFKKFF